MFSSFCRSESGEKFAEPVHTSGSSESGSISRDFVCTKNTKPSWRKWSSFSSHLSSSNSAIGARRTGTPFLNTYACPSGVP